MENNNSLQQLLQELGCKTRIEEIPSSGQKILVEFLKREKQLRHTQRLQRLLATCGINKHQVRTFEQFDWNFNPRIPKEDILALKNSSWISKPTNLVLLGDAGIGKSHIAKAFCYDAIAQGHKTYFINAFDLVSKIKKAPYPLNKIDYYGRTVKVLCIDELGYTFHPKEDTDLIFQIISKRSELLPTIVTSNLAPKKWGSIFSGPAASAILDRLSFNGKFLTWEGDSYRAKVRK